MYFKIHDNERLRTFFSQKVYQKNSDIKNIGYAKSSENVMCISNIWLMISVLNV